MNRRLIDELRAAARLSSAPERTLEWRAAAVIDAQDRQLAGDAEVMLAMAVRSLQREIRHGHAVS